MVRMTLAVTAFALAVASPAAYAADAAQMEANKKTVAALYDAVLNQKDFEKASQYLGPRYTQHNPNAADGPEGLKGFIGFLKDKFPNNRSEIKRIFADGDYVIVHVHAVREPGTRGNASSTSSSSRTARWSSTGTLFSRSRRRPPTTTQCFDGYRPARSRLNAATASELPTAASWLISDVSCAPAIGAPTG
jgi:predicted SnoaL-like aldol condensation-catalyzing enzyme